MPVLGSPVSVLVSQIKTEAGFDITDDQALRWLNARHRKMLARSHYLKARVSLGTTVAGQAYYPFDSDIVEIYDLDVGGVSYTRIGRDDADSAARGRLRITRAFYPDHDATGATRITLYPAPSTGGVAIEAYAAIQPPDLTLTDYPKVPVDFQDALVEGAIATGMARDIEQVAVADRFEARFDAACQELRRRAAGRVRGDVVQMRIVGINA